MSESAETTTLDALVEELTARLRPSLGGAARSETRRLVALATGADRTALLTRGERPVGPDAAARARALAERRAAGEPFAYLAGAREFWGLDFAIGPGVLVPRPESETMIEAALAHLPPERTARVLDLGTGSGCLLLAVLHARPHAFGLGVERSAAALAYAARNRKQLGLADRCGLVRASWLDAVAGRFDLVLANPPYIPAGEIDPLMTGGRGLEPHRAPPPKWAPGSHPLPSAGTATGRSPAPTPADRGRRVGSRPRSVRASGGAAREAWKRLVCAGWRSSIRSGRS